METDMKVLKLEKRILELESALNKVRIEAITLKDSLDNSIFVKRKMSEGVMNILKHTEL